MVIYVINFKDCTKEVKTVDSSITMMILVCSALNTIFSCYGWSFIWRIFFRRL